jgi:phage shock protein PspC (stress-responsive transcriptional regulator)
MGASGDSGQHDNAKHESNMNKVVQVNLGGIAFTIDDDAYRRLDAYMLDLERHFATSGNPDEIMADIESRISEILTELLKSRKIVEITDVEATIKIMGTPSDIGETSYGSEIPTGGRGPWDIKTGKKLFRNPDDKVIGGVCSGLAAYFGVQEVLWVRLAFVIVFLTMGFGIIVYLVMWALVPEAKTAADRLAMMGEQANVNNIARMVERGIDDLSTTIKDNWSNWQTKKKSKRSARTHSTGQTSDDKGTVILAALLVPIILAARLGLFILNLLRKLIGRSKLSFQRNQFV